MTTLADIWPPYRLRLRAGDLELAVISDGDIPGLVDLALAGIHAVDAMPFSVPWTLTPPDRLPTEMVRYYWTARASLRPDDFDLWLDPREEGVAKLRALLRAYPADGMAMHPVDTRVNDVRNDDPSCIEPVEPPADPQGSLF